MADKERRQVPSSGCLSSQLVKEVPVFILSWTSELAPIKQSGAVSVVLFSSWGFCVAVAGLYLLIGYKLGAAMYLLIWTVLLTAVALLLLRWLDISSDYEYRYKEAGNKRLFIEVALMKLATAVTNP